MSNGRSTSRHYCDYSECGKSFQRAEHLTRHKLNHTNSTIQCSQCDRLFYRRDLLQRHLMLKHGITSTTSRGAHTESLPLVGISSPTPHDRTHNPVRPGQNIQETEEFGQFPPRALTVDTPMNDATTDDVLLPISGDLFTFPSPSIDIAQDWSWLHQNPLPAFPASSDLVGQIDSNNDLPGFQFLNDGWLSPSISQSLHISQEIYASLVTLGPVIEANHSFTTEDISLILNTAFLFIMESLPIFHQPTFSFDLIQRELCGSIFCVGLLIAHDPVLYQIGCALLRQTRSQLLQYIDKNTIYLADLGILQAMLLVEFSGMYLADRTAMELSDIFHGSLVTLSRRLGLFEMTYNNMRAASASSDGLESQNPVQQESAKRLAYFVFALDVEHALYFGHERSILSIYSMKLELPVKEEEHTKRNGPIYRTKFHLLCHNLLSNPQSHTTIPPNLTQLSNLIILLGLASVVLDLLRRQPDPFFDTKQALSRLGVVLPAIHSRIIAGPEGSMKVHGRTVYHITAISLCTPLEDLERAANDGFSRTGRTPKHHTRAAIIRLLTKHKVGAEPARHAIQLLRLYMIPLANLEAHSTQSADVYMTAPCTSLPAGYSRYEPSALYFGVLTLWAYIIGRLSDDDGDDSQLGQHSYSPDENLETQRMTSSSSPVRTSIATLLQGIEAAINNDDSLACRTHWRTIVQHATAFLALRRNNNAQEYSQVLTSLSNVISV